LSAAVEGSGTDLDEDDFDAAFRRLYRPAFGVAYRIVGNGADAEQLASEALARAFASWRRISRLPHLDAWVMRVTANLALDAARRRRPVPEPGPDLDPEETTVLRLALGDALRRLPRRQRDVIVLRHLAGHTEAEVADLLGISIDSVHTHARRGRSNLRRTLGPQWEPQEGTNLAY
jgi:RNA polymerase sigma factor (sigma-70 family)